MIWSGVVEQIRTLGLVMPGRSAGGLLQSLEPDCKRQQQQQQQQR